MRLLRTFQRAVGRYSCKLPLVERAENIGTVDHRLKPRQRLRAFFLERGAERLGILLQRFEPDLLVEGGIRRCEATNLES